MEHAQNTGVCQFKETGLGDETLISKIAATI